MVFIYKLHTLSPIDDCPFQGVLIMIGVLVDCFDDNGHKKTDLDTRKHCTASTLTNESCRNRDVNCRLGVGKHF